MTHHLAESMRSLPLLPEAIRCYGRLCEQLWSCRTNVTKLAIVEVVLGLTPTSARLAQFLKCIGVLGCEEMDMCIPPDSDMVAQAVLQWAGSCRQQLLHAGATVHNTHVQ
jgi:hypothetical protein